MMLFFSKNPNFVASLSGAVRITLGGYPVSIVNFKNGYTREEIIIFISAYCLYILC